MEEGSAYGHSIEQSDASSKYNSDGGNSIVGVKISKMQSVGGNSTEGEPTY